ncbi:thioesterase II family protein [Streptomyces sp. 8N114]|uniref:thioesterase II family protein n=1 Tax=Streptomyces sp. 8N114 TaxID=3457419 RepID=UPI003FD5D8C6
MTDRWLRCRTARTGAEVRVVCLPHAGGTAGPYAAWGTGLPESVELSAVQYPGREDRISEPPVGELEPLLSGLCSALLPLTDRPLVLFGHSLGALVAYEAARRLTALGAAPAHLVVSGRRAPSLPVGGDLHTRSDDALVAELRRLGGTHDALLRDPVFRSVYLPAVRADFRLAETYQHVPGPPLDCPVTAAIGDSDTEVDSPQAERWSDHTAGRFALRTFSGGHFYFNPGREPVLGLLRDVARSAGTPAVPGRSAESETLS